MNNPTVYYADINDPDETGSDEPVFCHVVLASEYNKLRAERDELRSQAVSDKLKKFALGDLVQKKSGSAWSGKVVGWYSTELTPEGYAVESDVHPGSVQIYPAVALEAIQKKESGDE